MTWQAFFQHLYPKSEEERFQLVAQITLDRDGDSLREWLIDLRDLIPLPEGTIWMWCNQDSPRFIKGLTDGRFVTS